MIKLRVSYRDPAELARFLAHNRASIVSVSKPYRQPNSPFSRVYVVLEAPWSPPPESCGRQPEAV
jgi:hypothetical protein